MGLVINKGQSCKLSIPRCDIELKEVSLIMNFEARGNRGPSMLFETSPGNSFFNRKMRAQNWLLTTNWTPACANPPRRSEARLYISVRMHPPARFGQTEAASQIDQPSHWAALHPQFCESSAENIHEYRTVEVQISRFPFDGNSIRNEAGNSMNTGPVSCLKKTFGGASTTGELHFFR